MGLTMSEKKALTKEIGARYRQAERKEKTAILDEFIKTSGYNRKYASRMLKQQGLKKRVKAAKKKRTSNHQGKLVYGPDFVNVLQGIWQFFWYKCGKYLAPFMQETMPYLEASKEPDFHLTPEIKQKLLKISPTTIDRKLKNERAKLRIKFLIMRLLPCFVVKTEHGCFKIDSDGFHYFNFLIISIPFHFFFPIFH
ncbi:hypothetical protein FACS1894109_09810 [Spirochaetia bacterium]|nr:hypothetical protein FACS1894109_09810 [Spirochaetia bacterium]